MNRTQNVTKRTEIEGWPNLLSEAVSSDMLL